MSHTSNVIAMKGIREVPKGAPKSVRSYMDTLMLSPEGVTAWKSPPFQRPLRVNSKVKALVEELKINGGVLPGVLTIGIMGKEKFLIDGQHRVEAFKLSEMGEGYADVRVCYFDDIAEMGQEFVNLNSAIVRLRPDDILRGLEASHAGISIVRKRCPFIGYDYIRRGAASPIVSMSLALRAWFNSAVDTPASSGMATSDLSSSLTEDEAAALSEYFGIIFAAWGKDAEYARLWAGLNMTVTAWMFRRIVLTQYSPNTVRLTKAQFSKCATSLSANGHYLDWLVGRQLCDRDRAPCYSRIKEIFTARLREEMPGKHIRLPGPTWAHGSGGGNRKAIV